MLETRDIYWAAGFLDGEGWFVNQRSMPVIKAKQNNPELLYRLQNIFGGEVNPKREIKSGKYKGNFFGEYYLGTDRAAGIMMILFPLMSQKRKEEIKEVLGVWKAKPLRSTKTIERFGKCAKGHEWIEENINTIERNGKLVQRCNLCILEAKRNWHNKNKIQVNARLRDKRNSKSSNLEVK